jgi:FkbM family methyltransferase
VAGDLAFDVGMHDGADTAYYLALGLRVVAIEANPALVGAAAERFADAMRQGRLALVHAAVSERDGLGSFFVSDDNSEWSSVHPAIAGRRGNRHHEIEVPCRTFASLLREHGMPRYCKIDIEGADGLCLDAFDPRHRPEYVSVELGGRMRSWQPLEQLRELGYRRFKVIDQVRLRPANLRLYERLARLPPPAARAAVRVDLRTRPARDGRWRFPAGASGPLPDRTPGAWCTYAQASDVARRVVRLQRDTSLPYWYDVHATA